MFKVKRCANCIGNNFNIISDNSIISLICSNCGQVYPTANLKRLPDDIEASNNIKISIQPETRSLVHV